MGAALAGASGGADDDFELAGRLETLDGLVERLPQLAGMLPIFDRSGTAGVPFGKGLIDGLDGPGLPRCDVKRDVQTFARLQSLLQRRSVLRQHPPPGAIEIDFRDG